jgi:ribonuclease HI
MILFFDGGCEPRNPGGRMMSAFVIIDDHGTEHTGAITTDPAPTNTNNLAEWTALGIGIRKALELAETPIALEIRGDSKLVIEQLCGGWACNTPHLRRCRDRCRELLTYSRIERWAAKWIPREQNERADQLGREAYRKAEGQYPPERKKRTA